MAVSTPATDGKRVYAVYGTGDLVCVDLEGKPVWIRSLAEEYGPFRNRWGMSASPILVGELLVVQVDHWGQSYLLAVDARTCRVIAMAAIDNLIKGAAGQAIQNMNLMLGLEETRGLRAQALHP